MKALIAMSGGVDSSVAAALMKEEGYVCTGVTMKLYANEDIGVSKEKACCTLDDAEDAARVARKLGMRHYVFNFMDDFRHQVIDRFVSAYECGATPNPCIDCNRYMKFEKLYGKALELGCDCIVTGHYARTCFDEDSGRWQLKRGLNREKDQSYVLCFMTQEQLAHTQFPLGTFETKEAVREVAERYGFVNARKKDSQDICFVPGHDHADFIRQYTGKEYSPGAFVTEDGRVLGQHKGIIRYTVGQRKGLGLALPAPLYVREKDVENNRVILSPEDRLYSRELTADDVNWVSVPPLPEGQSMRVSAKTRYRAKEAAATVTALPGGEIRLVFDEPQRAITKGQAVVLYDGDLVAAGGTIM